MTAPSIFGGASVCGNVENFTQKIGMCPADQGVQGLVAGGKVVTLKQANFKFVNYSGNLDGTTVYVEYVGYFKTEAAVVVLSKKR